MANKDTEYTMKKNIESEDWAKPEGLSILSSDDSILGEVIVDTLPQIEDTKKEQEEKMRLCQEEVETEERLMFAAPIEHTQSKKPLQKGLGRVFSQGRNLFRKLIIGSEKG